MEKDMATGAPDRKARLWNMSFLLLWQGQFVSALGDVVYEIALGFWILAVTGSTGLMGALMAATTIPRVLISPFAGVIVDRTNRRWLLVTMDVMRGAAVVLVGAAALLGIVKVWMVFGAGIIIGIGAAFFNTAIASVLPDIVSRERLVQGNSFFAMIRAGSGILGNSVGGFLYALLGAPLMFLVNGISYIASAVMEMFIRVPNVRRRRASGFGDEMRSGFAYVRRNAGLRFLIVSSGVINFLAFIAIVLIIPLFQRSPSLGPARYGVAIAVMTAGMVVGMGVTALIRIPARRRLLVFCIGTVAFVLPMAVFPLVGSYWIMLVLLGVGSVFGAIINVLIQSVLQLTVPREMRGKIFGLLETLTQGLTPVGMAIGGLLGELLPLKLVISGACIAIGAFIFPQLASPSIRAFFTIDEELVDGAPGDGA
jgi:MFS transporter, DHA3 family, macrolide efflux protein